MVGTDRRVFDVLRNDNKIKIKVKISVVSQCDSFVFIFFNFRLYRWGTADWTSYLIYFFISIGISGITILFPLGLKNSKRNM